MLAIHIFMASLFFFFYTFQSHSENPDMPLEEKQSLHTQDQEEMPTVEEGKKESKSVLFIYVFFILFNVFTFF